MHSNACRRGKRRWRLTPLSRATGGWPQNSASQICFGVKVRDTPPRSNSTRISWPDPAARHPAPRELQRAEEGVAVSLPPRGRSPAQRHLRAHHQPRHGWSCPAQQDTKHAARHCQLRAGNHRLGLWTGVPHRGKEAVPRGCLGRRARASHLVTGWPISTGSKRMSKIPKPTLEFEVDLAHSSPSRKAPGT